MDQPTRISKEDLRRRLDAGERVVIVDSRSPASWDESNEKLPGAIRIPADEVANHLDQVEKGHLVVTYCT